ncbi:MAG TPA: MotA/TolQ/ExbB proton channel family protein [Planctomycetota bacterium]|nr:MotA/TolQ/ExbB proton channel family protein [Planctomycetota bacterium]
MVTRKWWLAAVVVTAMLAAVVGTAVAQDTSGEGEKPEEVSMLDILWESSYIGAVIGILSFAMLGLVIEHFSSIKDEKLIPPDFVAALQTSIDEKKYQDAMQLCEASDNYISRIMQVGLSEIRFGYEAMTESMSAIGEEESIKLNQKIGYLSLIGTLAPMLGLLGTVVGMIGCFKTISEAPVTNARDLAGGIYMALVTTVMGLIVGIPALFFHSFFQDRVTNIGLEAGAVCEELIRRFKPVKVAGADVPRPTAPAAK